MRWQRQLFITFGTEQSTARRWYQVRDGNRDAFVLYRRHYAAKKNRKPKLRLFVGPGEKLVLITPERDALFAWRKFIDDSGQQGVNCAVFRNESQHRSSDLILEAMEHARCSWPGERVYTFVDSKEISSTNPGYCFQQAGWRKCGRTAKGLIILEAFL